MGACNDCGAEVGDLEELRAHADATHPGMGRIRYWDGGHEVVVSDVPVVPASERDALQAQIDELRATVLALTRGKGKPA